MLLKKYLILIIISNEQELGSTFIWQTWTILHPLVIMPQSSCGYNPFKCHNQHLNGCVNENDSFHIKRF